MKLIAKIIFLSSAAYILLCIALKIILESSNFEFRHGVDWFDYALTFGIPIALFLTLFRIVYSNNSSELVIAQTVGTIGFAVFFFLYFIVTIAFDLCGSTTGKVLYQSKHAPSKRIEAREFGCGAVDSGPPSISYAEVKDYPLGLIYVTRIDTMQIDLSKWRKVNL